MFVLEVLARVMLGLLVVIARNDWLTDRKSADVASRCLGISQTRSRISCPAQVK